MVKNNFTYFLEMGLVKVLLKSVIDGSFMMVVQL